jgi:hypothetical protein
LEQWRAYTPDSGGVSLGLGIEPLFELGRELNAFALVKICYSPDELRNATERICHVALRLTSSRQLVGIEIEQFWSEAALLLFNFALRFKHPGFGAEREWRILKLEPAATSVMQRERDGVEIKYIKIAFRPEMVTRITVGPRAPCETELMLRRFLDENALRGVNVYRSQVPLR